MSVDGVIYNYKWFPWNICNGCGMPMGNAYPYGHLVPTRLGLAYAPIVETSFPNLRCLFSTFYLENRSVLSRFVCIYIRPSVR